jgi:hypothetical protein
MLILNNAAQPFVQCVARHDRSPGYAERYARIVKEYLDPAAVLRWVEVDVSSTAEYGPHDIAVMPISLSAGK